MITKITGLPVCIFVVDDSDCVLLNIILPKRINIVVFRWNYKKLYYRL